jgi:hypothetical protein
MSSEQLVELEQMYQRVYTRVYERRRIHVDSDCTCFPYEMLMYFFVHAGLDIMGKGKRKELHPADQLRRNERKKNVLKVKIYIYIYIYIRNGCYWSCSLLSTYLSISLLTIILLLHFILEE